MTAAVEIQGRARPDPGYFAFTVKAVPATPTHCRWRGCKTVLEPMRRYAGLCKVHVAKAAKRAAKKRLGPQRIIRSFMRHGERHIEVECSCGDKRVMRLSTYNTQRPTRCKRCRLREAADLRAAAREAHRARKKPQPTIDSAPKKPQRSRRAR